MRIKSLYIKGFKTFYEKSIINFDSEISTIVGPNGCGKTNLLDAMRWVLGEQNPRLLRLDSMSQVVADGNDNLPKQNFAEVSLLVENEEENEFVETEIKREVEIYNYYLYERQREKLYPDWKTQMDMLYHDIKNKNLENGSWIQSIDKIKSRYPKPE